MLTKMALRVFLKSPSVVLRECGALTKLTGTSGPLPPKHGSCTLALPRSRDTCGVLSSPVLPTVRHYARKKPVPESQLSDLQPSMLKMDYTAVPVAQTTDDLVKRLISLELACHSDKLRLKKEQLVKKVQRDENDQSSVEVKVAILTAKIRNYKEHLLKHHKDKANKRHMLMAVDQRTKLLKKLRLVNHEAFQRLCSLLDVSYSFPPEYYRPVTHRWLAKKALCIKVFQEVQKQNAEKRLRQEVRTSTSSSSFSPSSSSSSSSSTTSPSQ